MNMYWKTLPCAFLLVALQACNNGERKDSDQNESSLIDSLNDTTERAHALNADVNLTGDEKTFAVSAAAGGLMEVEAASLVLKKSKNKEILAFATQMLKDHGQANTELNAIASAKGMQLLKTLPEEMAGHLKAMNAMADHAFDLQYLRMMINDHEKTIQLFNEGSRVADAELKNFAAKTLPVLQQHYEKAVALGKKFNISNVNRGDDPLGISPSPAQTK